MRFTYGEPWDAVKSAGETTYSFPALALPGHAYLILFSFEHETGYSPAEAAVSFYRLSPCCGKDLLNGHGDLFTLGDAGEPLCEGCQRAWGELAQRPHSASVWAAHWDGRGWARLGKRGDRALQEWQDCSGFDPLLAQLTALEFFGELEERAQGARWASAVNSLTLSLD